jgi:hypothetical protein
MSHLLDDLDLPVEASGAALHQRDICCQTHLVHMPPRIQVVERVEDDVEGLEPRDIELRALDVVVIGLDLDVGVELARRLFRNLLLVSAHAQFPLLYSSRTHQRLGLLDVLIAEQKLPVEIAEIDGVQVDDVDLAKACEDEILEQLAADAASSHHQNARLPAVSSLPCSLFAPGGSCTSVMRACSVPRLR